MAAVFFQKSGHRQGGGALAINQIHQELQGLPVFRTVQHHLAVFIKEPPAPPPKHFQDHAHQTLVGLALKQEPIGQPEFFFYGGNLKELRKCSGRRQAGLLVEVPAII